MAISQNRTTIQRDGLGSDCKMLFDDPVDLAAPLARDLSERHCRIDPVSGESCAWYHGALLVLRALRIGRGDVPGVHREFLDRALRQMPREGNSISVLISGSADYLMPSLVLNTYSCIGMSPHLTVVYICETPLLMNSWYAVRYGIAVDVRHCDILAYEPERPTDIVCTHHFFNYFARETRPSVVEQWRALLRPGGRLLLVNRYRMLGQPPQGGYSEAECTALVESALTRMRQRTNGFPFSEREVEDMVRRYGARIRAQTLDSPGELLGLLQNGGFEIEAQTIFSERRIGGARTTESIGVVARRL